MKPILIHCHIFYVNLWEQLKNCINNIVSLYPFELYITMVEKHKNIIDDIKNNFPQAKIEIMKENKGYDVWPFINIINKLNLDNYSYIIKIHTKRDMPGSDINKYGSKWRDILLRIVSSKDNIKKCISSFEKDIKLGMIADFTLISNSFFDYKIEKKIFKEFLHKNIFLKKKYVFVQGTMFICRSFLLKPIQQLKLTSKNFEVSDNTHKSINMAHIMERFFGYCITYQNYKIKDVFTKKMYQLLAKPIMNSIQKKTTKSNRILIKFCKIPIFFFKKRNEK